MPVKKSLSKKIKRTPSTKKVISLKKSIYSRRILFSSLFLLMGLLITVVTVQQQQIATQYAQTVPTTTIAPSMVTPTFGCLGTSCAGTIMPTVVTTVPTASSSPGVTVILPTNPNGKTPPGFFISIAHRVRNWISKYIRFGGNPPGNPNIPGTNVNPVSSTSGNLSGAKLQGNRTITIITPAGSNKNASGGGTITPPATQPNIFQLFLKQLQNLFAQQPTSPKK